MGEAIRVLVGINDPIFYHSLQASLAQHDQITFIGHSGEGNRSDLTGFLPVELETLQAKNLSGLLRD